MRTNTQTLIGSTLATLGVAALFLAGAPVVRAQETGLNTAATAAGKKVTLNLENADLRFALKILFNSVGANFTLDPAVQGQVSANLTDVPFKVALESVLKAASSESRLTYRVEDDVYHVSPRVEDHPVIEAGAPDTDVPERKLPRLAKITLNFADATDLAQIFGGTVIQSRFGANSLGFGNGFGQGGLGQGGTGQGGFGQGGFGQGGFGQGGFGQGGQGGFSQFGGNGFGGNGFGGNSFGGNGFGGNGGLNGGRGNGFGGNMRR